MTFLHTSCCNGGGAAGRPRLTHPGLSAVVNPLAGAVSGHVLHQNLGAGPGNSFSAKRLNHRPARCSPEPALAACPTRIRGLPAAEPETFCLVPRRGYTGNDYLIHQPPVLQCLRPLRLKLKSLVALAALLMTACVPIQPRSLVPPTAAAPEPELSHVAPLGAIAVSDGEWNQWKAVDGSIETWWSADDFAPQWIEIYLSTPTFVEAIELIAAQSSSGPVTHRVSLENLANDLLVWHRFDSESAADGDIFRLIIDPPQLVSKVRILTTRGQGWVAWREVRVLASGHPTTLGQSIEEIEAVATVPSGSLNFVQITHAGDGSGRLFLVDKQGRIHIVKDGLPLETPFLDISERISAEGPMQGLLNLAFPPSYPISGQFYVSYTDTEGTSVISRFAAAADPDIADPDSEEIVLTVEQPGRHHHVGTLKFGPRDGYLYIGSGDGMNTSAEDMPQQAQDPSSLLGKILRIDVEAGVQPYAIPADNPFVSIPGYAPEIWALGLRNPWGFAFDQQTGDLYIPDSGWITSEEVNFQPAGSGGGENYGWPHWEGFFPHEVEGVAGDYVWPLATYGREEGCVIVGGAVHDGRFIFGDFCTGKVSALRCEGESLCAITHLYTTDNPLSSIGVDESGNLYTAFFYGGTVWRLVWQGVEDEETVDR